MMDVCHFTYYKLSYCNTLRPQQRSETYRAKHSGFFLINFHFSYHPQKMQFKGKHKNSEE